MRHGNKNNFFTFAAAMSDSDPTYEAWKPWEKFVKPKLESRTPILPMRHGNKACEALETSRTITPILPMRHGNYVIIVYIPTFQLRYSDPTYEAWKLALNTFEFNLYMPLRSYL